MDTDLDPLPTLLASHFNLEFFILLGVICILLVLSALVSGSEVAYFSLTPQDRTDLEEDDGKVSQRVIALIEQPKRLLATILIANNFINVAIVILSSTIVARIFAATSIGETAQYIIQVGVVTFIILLIGEVIPKVYATKNGLAFARIMSGPLAFSKTLFRPLSSILVNSTSFIDKRIKKSPSEISVDQLEQALELANEDGESADKESQILKGIVKFGNTDVKQIMTPRVDLIALEVEDNYQEVMEVVLENGYSRLPVYKESFDQIVGVLYVKDLLNHIDKPEAFNWHELVRDPLFVPENKKIDDLLREFQDEKVHMAIVVDEYGGTSGAVTFEDVIEEIVGDISDEFDDEDIIYSKLDDNNYVFEGKTPLIDVYRILEIEGDSFESVKGEADSLAGFLIEISGKILKKQERINFENFQFTIEAADKKRVKQVKVTILEIEDENEE